MYHIEPRKNITTGKIKYRVKVLVNGNSTSKTFPNKTLAKAWGQMQELQMLENTHFPQHHKTLNDMVEKLLSTPSQMSIKHQKDTQRNLRVWQEHLGRYKLSEITSEHIDDVKHEFAKEHEGATVNRLLTSLSTLFNKAIKVWKWTKYNPVTAVQRMKENKRRRFLKEDERLRLLDACKQSNTPELYPLVMLALSTAGRRSELLGLTWDAIDFDRDQVIFFDTKNGSSRNLPLDESVKYFFNYRKSQGAEKPFTTFPRKAFENALKRANIQDFKFHDFRHTVASYMAMNGATDRQIMAVGGWESVEMVGRYAHLRENYAKEAIKGVASMLTKS